MRFGVRFDRFLDCFGMSCLFVVFVWAFFVVDYPLLCCRLLVVFVFLFFSGCVSLIVLFVVFMCCVMCLLFVFVVVSLC